MPNNEIGRGRWEWNHLRSGDWPHQKYPAENSNVGKPKADVRQAAVGYALILANETNDKWISWFTAVVSKKPVNQMEITSLDPDYIFPAESLFKIKRNFVKNTRKESKQLYLKE